MATDNGGIVEFTTLGRVGLERNGEPIDLGRRLRRLLAALVVARNETVSIDRLTDIVWEGAPPPSADTTLRSYVTRLRQAIGADAGDQLVRHGPGYALHTDAGMLDSACFDTELDEAIELLRGSEFDRAHALLSTALARWKGPAYAEFANEEWAEAEATRLEERRFDARARSIESSLHIGATAEAAADARALIADAPLADAPRALLMRALAASGRQAEALREFSAFRRAIAEETGLDPSPELTDLERRIALGEDTTSVRLQSARSYQIGERIGRGSTSVVHRARQPELDRDVAIKIIRPGLADSPEFIRRFEYEARISAQLQHPSIVPVIDYWREPGAAYIVSSLMEGGSLQAARRAGADLQPEQAAAGLRRIADALDHMHRLGLTHGDVSESNVLLDGDDEMYLGDFGLAAAHEAVRNASEPNDFAGRRGHDINGLVDIAVSLFGDLDTQTLPTLDLTTASSALNQLIPHIATTPTGHPARSFDASNPYVGLVAFDERHHSLFFGRTGLTNSILQRVAAKPLTVVVGPSGCGKSSVVRAGVVPSLRSGALPASETWLISTMTPGSEPFEQFALALARVASTDPAAWRPMLEQPGGIANAINAAIPSTDDPLLLVIDQLEELFTLDDGSGNTDRFLDELSSALLGDQRLRVVATLRADHFGGPLGHQAFAQLLDAGTVAVGPMSASELTEAIITPARTAGVEVEADLVSSLVADVLHSPGSLPLLQFALTEMFDHKNGSSLGLDDLERLGGLTGAMAARAEQVVASAERGDRAAVRRMFARLVVLSDQHLPTRRRALRSELALDQKDSTLIDAFVEARLLRTDREDTSRLPTVEVAHEALLTEWPRLSEWIEDDRHDLITLNQATAASRLWDRADRPAADLARGARLDLANGLLRNHPDWLDDVESSWVEASVTQAAEEESDRAVAAERDRRQVRRLRSLLATAAALLVVAAVAIGGVLVLRNRAESSAESARVASDDADIERLVALSASEISSAPDRAILLALEANRRRDNFSTQTAVHRAIATEPRIASIFPDPTGEASSTKISKDGSFGITGGLGQGTVTWFDGRSGESTGSVYESGASLLDLDVSGNGRTAGIVLDDGSVRFIDQLGDVADPVTPTLRPQRIALDSAGTVAAAITDSGEGLAVIDISSGEITGTFPLDDGVVASWIEISGDGSTVAISTTQQFFSDDVADGVLLIDAATGATLGQVSTPGRYVSALDFGANQILAAGFNDGTVTVVDATDTSNPVATDFRAGSDIIDSIAVGDGRVVTASELVRFWTFDGSPAGRSFNATQEVDAVRESSSGLVIASLRSGGRVVLDERSPSVITQQWPVDIFAQLSPELPFYDTPSTDFSAVKWVRFDDNTVAAELSTAEIHPNGTGAPFYSANGEWVLTYDQALDNAAISEITGDQQYLIDMGELKETLVGRRGNLPISVRPNDRGDSFFVAIGASDGAARAAWFDSATSEIVSGPVETSTIGRSMILEDGTAVVGGETSDIVLFDPELVGEPVSVASTGGLSPYHEDRTTGRFVIGGPGGRFGIVDPADASFRPFSGAEGLVYAAAFSPDGATIATASFEAGVQLFDVASGDRLGVAVSPGVFDGSGGEGIRWDPDGTGVWIAASVGPTRFAVDPAQWVATACSIVGRMLDPAEWQQFVDADSDPIDPCSDGADQTGRPDED